MDMEKEQRREKYFIRVRKLMKTKPVMTHPLKKTYDRNDVKREFSKLIREEINNMEE